MITLTEQDVFEELEQLRPGWRLILVYKDKPDITISRFLSGSGYYSNIGSFDYPNEIIDHMVHIGAFDEPIVNADLLRLPEDLAR
ncbi:MAG: hypothetical protein WC783_02675 [Candidatus Paceibacterota bacterium]|jgi:hypothetical protein